MLDPSLVVLYHVPEDGPPVQVAASPNPELVAAVVKLFGAALGLSAPTRVFELRTGAAAGGGNEHAER